MPHFGSNLPTSAYTKVLSIAHKTPGIVLPVKSVHWTCHFFELCWVVRRSWRLRRTCSPTVGDQYVYKIMYLDLGLNHREKKKPLILISASSLGNALSPKGWTNSKRTHIILFLESLWFHLILSSSSFVFFPPGPLNSTQQQTVVRQGQWRGGDQREPDVSLWSVWWAKQGGACIQNKHSSAGYLTQGLHVIDGLDVGLSEACQLASVTKFERQISKRLSNQMFAAVQISWM